MVQLSIMRRIKFCAGHRLLGHEGKCRHFHGHNYVADFYVTGSKQDAVGRVIDFSLLKKKLKGWIDDHWDHAMVLWDADENALAAAKQVQPCRIYELPYNPTAENMARYLLEVAAPVILSDTGAQAIKVVLWESDECFAEVALPHAAAEPMAMIGSAEQV
jgi:6-pyruvoyltetrahydropterin/6-carboxytetrahydropterin synthase